MSRDRERQRAIKKAAAPTKTQDAFSNPMARLGYGQQNLLEGTQYPLTRFTREYATLNAMYRSEWLVRKIIDSIPEDMCKNWYSIKSQVKPDLIDRLTRMEERCMVKAKILEGLKWGRLYGGAGGIMLIDGHQDKLHEKLDYDTIMPGAFKGLLIVDRWSGLAPGLALVEDINDPEFGLPDYYNLTVQSGRVFKVDHSRVLRFIGRDVPYLEKLAEQYWGISEIEVVNDELKKRNNTSWNIANLIFLACLRVIKQGDLGETLALGTEKEQQDLYNSIQAQNALMSSMGLMVLNKDDDFTTHSYQFSGIDSIYENFMMDVAGAAETPVTKLFGRSPAGLNATGESDQETYDGTIEQKQAAALRPVLNKLIPVMCVSEWGAIPDDLDYKFNSVRKPKDKDLADLSKTMTENVIEAYNAGLISQKTALKELRQQSEITGQWTNITDEDIEMADDSTNQGEMLSNIPGLGGEVGGQRSLGTSKADREKLPGSSEKPAE